MKKMLSGALVGLLVGLGCGTTSFAHADPKPIPRDWIPNPEVKEYYVTSPDGCFRFRVKMAREGKGPWQTFYTRIKPRPHQKGCHQVKVRH
jgi:hypothetical protein